MTLDKPLNPSIKCADGFSMSVQGSRRHYCKPRTDSGPYIELEIGFPTEEEPLLSPYQHAPDMYHPTEAPYYSVPIEVINKVIEKHGGIVVGQLPS